MDVQDRFTMIEPDIWIEVFRNLPVADRFRVRKVCTTFREHFNRLSTRMKRNRTPTTIRFNPLSTNVKSRNNDHTSTHFNEECIIAILNVYGSNAKKIIFDQEIPPIDNLNRLDELICHNAVARDLINLCGSDNKFQALTIKSSDEDYSLFESALQYLIGINKYKLSSLTIIYTSLTGTCLMNVNYELITNLNLHTRITNKAILHNLIRNCTNLEKFSCTDIDFMSLSIISVHYTKLSELRLCVFDSPFIFTDSVDHSINDIFKKNQNLNTIKLKNFQYLRCFGNRRSNFNNLKTVDISSPGMNFLVEDFNEKLKCFSNLINLKLCNINVLFFSVLSVGIMSCVNLKFLNISFCDSVNDDFLIEACKTLTSLQSLHLSSLHNITYRSFESLTISCPKLNDLKIDNCCKITDYLIFVLKENKRDLKSLTLTNMHALCGTSLRHLTELKYLNLKNSTAIDPGTIIELIINNINLECINIRECVQFDNTFLISAIEFLNERYSDFNMLLKIRNTEIDLNDLNIRCRNLYIKP